MANLYEISAAILDCVDLETGEIIDVERLNELQMERDQKIESIALWHKNLLSDAKQYAEEEAAFKKKKQAAIAKAERLKEYLQDALQGDKFKSARVSIHYTRSSRVIVDDVLNLPPCFVRFADPEPNKTEIAAAIKNGEEVNGARLESNVSMIIK
jgi:hypothetical protein